MPHLAVALLLVLFTSRTAFAFSFEVEEWSVAAGLPAGAQVNFVDDFEDDVFGPAALYDVGCGAVLPGDESGGALALQRPGTAGSCLGVEIVTANVALGGDISVLASYGFEVPQLDESYGIGVGIEGGSDQVGLIVARSMVGSFDVLAIVVFDEAFVASRDPNDLLGSELLSLSPETFMGPERVALLLQLSEQGGAIQLQTAIFQLDEGAQVPIVLDRSSEINAAAVGAALVATGSVPEPEMGILLIGGLVLLGNRRGKHPINLAGRLGGSDEARLSSCASREL